MRRPGLVALVLLLAALGVSACGRSHERVANGDNTGAGGVNSSYLDVGKLQYQVQVSRQLNPSDPEDRSYLAGLPANGLKPGFQWFGVFVLVLNRTSTSQQPTQSFTLSDTQGHSFTPQTLGAQNEYAYRAVPIAAREQIPQPDTTAANGPTQAAVLVYRLPVTAYDNRPLTLKITDPSTNETGTVQLDV